jgi:endonuclease/exonuclease/phosphatase family metal-dependent hydrolase
VTVASLNLHCGFSSKGEPYDVVSAICELGADIVCLQENWLPYQRDPAGPDLSASGQVTEAARKLGAVEHSAVMTAWPSLAAIGLPAGSGPGQLTISVLTTLPVVSGRILELGRAPGDSVPRVGQAVRCSLPGGSVLDIVNTHLTHRFTSPLQLRKLQRLLRRSQQHLPPAPAVIAGDLNMPLLLADRAGGFRAAARGRSWPALRPLVQLDHILAGPGLAPVYGAALAPTGSDHRPVRARLILAGPGRPAAHR